MEPTITDQSNLPPRPAAQSIASISPTAVPPNRIGTVRESDGPSLPLHVVAPMLQKLRHVACFQLLVHLPLHAAGHVAQDLSCGIYAVVVLYVVVAVQDGSVEILMKITAETIV